jgi:hypothetical protein
MTCARWGRARTVALAAVCAAGAAAAALGAAAADSYRDDPPVELRPTAALLPACAFSDREDQTLAPARAAFQIRVAGPGNVGLSISNYGTVGNDHDTRSASFEFPNGSEIEHLIRGGLWIGAITSAAETLVSTASVDQNIAGAGDATTEFVPLAPFSSRSTLRNRPDFDPSAISEEDLIASFRDFPSKSASLSCPLGVEVTVTSIGWSFRPVDDFVILNYSVRNVSKAALREVYFGVFAEFATNFKGRYPEWPPSPVGVLFRNKVITWDDSLRLFTEHHCSFDRGAAPTFGGVKILGTRPEPLDSSKVVSFNWTDFNPGDESRNEDGERYRLISNGQSDSTEDVTSSCTAGGGADDPIEFISVGPYDLPARDTLSFTVAFVGGDNLEDTELNAAWAQRAFDANYIIPQPPPSPTAVVLPGPSELTVYWDAAPETIPDPASRLIDFEGYRVYISSDNINFDLVRDVDAIDSIGFNTGFAGVRFDTALVVDGDTLQARYRVTVPSLRNGFRYWASVTSYDIGDPAQGLPPLESGIPQNKTLFVPGARGGGASRAERVTVYPNPYRGQASWDGDLPREKLLWFNHLPERCVIRIFTMAGDIVDEIRFDGSSYRADGVFLLDRPDEDLPVLSGGQAAWDLITKEDQPVASGLYFFAVEDLATGETETGKFVILK